MTDPGAASRIREGTGFCPEPGDIRDMRSKLISTTVLACTLLCAASAAHAQTYEKLHTFTGMTAPANPFAALIQTSDGLFYGTTLWGGEGCGTVFVTDGAAPPTIVHSFLNTEGCNPTSGLLLAYDGNIYGLLDEGGQYCGGSMYRMTPAGEVTVIHHFQRPEGINPQFGLIQGSDGSFYGTTPDGGDYNGGTAFRADTW